MVMKFTFENTMICGEKLYRLIKTEGVLEYYDLPIEYVRSNDTPCIYTEGYEDVVIRLKGDQGCRRLNIGKLFTCKDIGPLLKDIKAAGKRLADINKKIKEEARNWEGNKWEVKI